MEYTQIRILREGLQIGNRKVAVGDLVEVAEISAATAELLIQNKRAEAVQLDASGKGK